MQNLIPKNNQVKNKNNSFLIKIKEGLLMINKTGLNNEEERSKWLKQVLSEIPEGSRILDAGAGELKYKKYCSHLKYVSQDFGQYDGQGDQQGLQTKTWDNSKLDIVSDITEIPEGDASFDAIMCVEVFEHLPSPVKAIEEFHRLLKPGGQLIITAPFCSLTHFAPYHFSSGYNRYFYEHHLLQKGFSITRIERNGNYFEYLAQEIRRIPSIKRRYSPKSSNIVLFFYYLMAVLILKVLEVFNRKDEGSNELLCFGYHILAKKK